ncbi:GNAT family N-acetyltransferase [Modestobacter versicolor]|uniref:GNAT family N-acetyltransferase n=1 Tax=Modestobacter versicolor TaxID=429133 RepID=A0A323VBX2_9ACTN|nr:GNAT family N-acetyltransferase [Modestobacter versicolor]MBB3674393.1 GNAT superfamily N-acetyltransferase [Modestobacter versicolor]PZA21690.1 GNAT family N-acetyltransferase [Modestobacter versicolor]
MPTVVDATAERWDDLAAVFGSRGDASRCWCQWFRHQRPGFYATTSEQRRADLQQQLAAEPPPGVLVHDDDGAPAGWCAIAPRAAYPRLSSYPVAAASADEDGLWAVTCFVVRVGKRRQGLAEVLLDGAVDLARRHGARTVEGYPLDTSVRTASAAELFHGPLSVFLRLGFTEVARTSKARPVVRLALEEGQR